MHEDLVYMNGFGNEFRSEVLLGAIPETSINAQRCKYDLFAEQLSGSSFTAPRGSNKRSWLYRKIPSVCHSTFETYEGAKQLSYEKSQVDPNQRRWKPFSSKLSNHRTDFIDGIHTLGFSDPQGLGPSSISIHIYLCNTSMNDRCFVNSDGDFLIVPQLGEIYITTEFGLMNVKPNEIAVVQQGMKFSISGAPDVVEMRGYILEVKGNHFELPYLGPIGANGLANPRDFQVPVARMDDSNKLNRKHETVLKFQNKTFVSHQDHSPYNVAGWFGNYTPYKYDLSKFVSLNSVSVDHPDPSIFTVLTCPSIGKPGTALADFVIFPPRWECARDTFRPPYFHRNCMTEFMGLIKGNYQAKSAAFAPGGGSLHQSMIAHGPDADCFKKASNQDTSVPSRVADETMAFMFETCMTLRLSVWGYEENVDQDYHKCWSGLAKS